MHGKLALQVGNKLRFSCKLTPNVRFSIVKRYVLSKEFKN